MAWLDFSEIAKEAKSLSIRKSRNGSITLSFSTYSHSIVSEILNSREFITVNIGFGSYDFSLKSFSKSGIGYNVTLMYSAFERMQLTRTVIFNTINENVKEMYDRSFIYYPYLTDYQNPDKLLFLKEVDNEFGINGWRVSEILEVLSNLLDVPIRTIDIPPSFDYHLKYFRANEGQNIFNVLSSLFRHVIFSVYKLGDEIYIRNVLDLRPPSFNGFDMCENIEISESFNVDLVIVRGDSSEPEYVDGVDGETIEIEDIVNGARRVIMFNKYGKEFLELVRETSLTQYTEKLRAKINGEE